MTVNADGSFSPQTIRIRAGDTVEWVLHDRTDSIIPAIRSGEAFLPKPYDADGFTGPMPYAPSGIFALGPVSHRGGNEASPATWKNPQITGVFIRLEWNDAPEPAGESSM